MVLYVELTHMFITIYYWHTEESRQVKFSLMNFFPWKEIMFHSPSGTFHMSGFFMVIWNFLICRPVFLCKITFRAPVSKLRGTVRREWKRQEQCSPAKTSCGVWLPGRAFQAPAEGQAFPGNVNVPLNNRKATLYHRPVHLRETLSYWRNWRNQ